MIVYMCKICTFRRSNKESMFLRVNIVLQGATFFIVLTDAEQFPPPYRYWCCSRYSYCYRHWDM